MYGAYSRGTPVFFTLDRILPRYCVYMTNRTTESDTGKVSAETKQQTITDSMWLYEDKTKSEGGGLKEAAEGKPE